MNNGILVNFRDDSLFWQSVSSVFSLSVLSLSHMRSPYLYATQWYLIWNFLSIFIESWIIYEFNLVFHLIKTFHIGVFLLTLPYDFLHLMLLRGLISFADHPHHQLEINLIANILSWIIGRLWIHHKILMSTHVQTSNPSNL